MLYLFTDFGWRGPYTGELRAVLARSVNIPIIDLMHDAPAYNPVAAAFLLSALSRQFQPGDYCLAIVDPGVGATQRRPVCLQADGITYVGPDNGLFSVLATQAKSFACHEILWRPAELSMSFHGRDLFAPVMVMEITSQGYEKRELALASLSGYGGPPNVPEVIYIDGYGNCITGLCAADLSTEAVLLANNVSVKHAPTFSAVPAGTPFWYINSMGLVEIACNQASAAERLGLAVGTRITRK